MALCGASSSISAAASAPNWLASSSGSTMYFCDRMPCFKAFRAERGLPSLVLGPRDFARLRLLASAWAWLVGTAARGDHPVGLGSGAPTPLRPGDPALDMAGFLPG
jgi:hypothetical protein